MTRLQYLVLPLLWISMSGCGGAASLPVIAAVIANANSSNSNPNPSNPSGRSPLLSQSCVSHQAGHQCLGLKVVSYVNNQVTVLNQLEAEALVVGINRVWSQCGIGFQLEQFESVDPSTRNLAYNTNWVNDADNVRSAFQDENKFLVVAVGTLGGSTIAVTQMPGGGPFGTLVESLYATNPLTVGHELGHYMGLYHVSDTSELMNPYIGSNTSHLTASECQIALETNLSQWTKMLR